MDEADFVRAAAKAIRQRWTTIPRVGLILGTGLGGLADSIETETLIDYEQIPHFPRSTAIGHQGRLVCGSLNQVPVLAMQGRCHLYEGYSWQQVTLPVRVMAELGVQSLVITNASGGVNPKFQPGDVMVMEDHIDLMFRSPWGWSARKDDRTTRMGRPGRVPRTYYDETFRLAALASARQANATAHSGVYVGLTGPTYETRSEYRMVRSLGGDAVGMSTVPEAIMGNYLKMRILAFSVITNLATPDALRAISGEEVVQAAQAAGLYVQQMITEIMPQLDQH